MSYVVLARRWRPKHFEEVVGQEHVARTLRNAISQDRVAHAFLFCGPRGVGKTSTARILAKALNCKEGPTETPCYTCASCREISGGSSMDVIEIDGASNRGVNEIRELREGVHYAPSRDRYKVYIIDEVHMLTTEAFNALLKTLEEPPGHVKFIFATTEPQKIPVTILSRCQRFDFKRISGRKIVAALRTIAASEGIEVEPGALALIANQADGGMRDALSLTDQIISFCGQSITESQVAEVLGVAGRKTLFALTGGLLDGDVEAALRILDEVNQAGYDLVQFAGALVSHLRDMAVVRVSQSAEGLTDMSPEELAVASAQVARSDVSVFTRMFTIMVSAAEEMARSSYPKLLFEMTLVKLAAVEPLMPMELVLRKLEALEAGVILEDHWVPPPPSTSGAPPPPPTGSSTPPSTPPAGQALKQASVGPTRLAEAIVPAAARVQGPAAVVSPPVAPPARAQVAEAHPVIAEPVVAAVPVAPVAAVTEVAAEAPVVADPVEAELAVVRAPAAPASVHSPSAVVEASQPALPIAQVPPVEQAHPVEVVAPIVAEVVVQQPAAPESGVGGGEVAVSAPAAAPSSPTAPKHGVGASNGVAVATEASETEAAEGPNKAAVVLEAIVAERASRRAMLEDEAEEIGVETQPAPDPTTLPPALSDGEAREVWRELSAYLHASKLILAHYYDHARIVSVRPGEIRLAFEADLMGIVTGRNQTATVAWVARHLRDDLWSGPWGVHVESIPSDVADPPGQWSLAEERTWLFEQRKTRAREEIRAHAIVAQAMELFHPSGLRVVLDADELT